MQQVVRKVSKCHWDGCIKKLHGEKATILHREVKSTAKIRRETERVWVRKCVGFLWLRKCVGFLWLVCFLGGLSTLGSLVGMECALNCSGNVQCQQ